LPKWWVYGFESHKGATKNKTMTQRKVDLIRKKLSNMTRKELQKTFILLFNDEMIEQDFKDLNLATDSRIRINILYGLSRFEYLAK
jgi:hypothetical protein